MPTDPAEHNWVIWRYRVQVFLCKVPVLRPFCLIPTLSQNPFPGLCLCDAFLYSFQRLVYRLCIVERNLGYHGFSHPEEVAVAINQTRHNCFTGYVIDLGARWYLYFVAFAHFHDVLVSKNNDAVFDRWGTCSIDEGASYQYPWASL